MILRPSRRRLVFLPALLLVLIIAAGFWLLADLPAPTAENLRAAAPSTVILDRNGRLLYEVIQEEGKHTPLAFEQIPAACWQATVAVEDSRFFQHAGVDLLAIGRAAWWNLRDGRIVSGASTLTQQLARNTMMTPEERFEQSYRRKLREAWLAWRIEQRFSKQEILALYLNQSYYGNFAVGLQAAAEAYFGKSAQELDLAECSLLAGLLQSPSLYNPLQNPEAARLRQSTVLGLMVWNGFIDREEAELALAETLHYAASPFPIEAPHFVSFVERQLDLLVGQEQARSGGLRILTTLDLDWQRQAEAIMRRRLAELADEPSAPPDRRVENAALVALDPQTGAILAMVGSPDYFDAAIDGAVNGAVALRQPGSAIKPITYAAAMDPQAAQAAGRPALTAATVIADVRTAFLTAEGRPYVPQNYDMTWHGPVSVRTALASSYNLPAVKVLDSIGVDALIRQAQRQGINTFRPGGGPDEPEPYGLALTLGGGEVSLLQLTGAYAAFANGGYHVEPHAIQRIEDGSGTVLVEAPAGKMGKTRERGGADLAASSAPALDDRVAYLITDILADNDARAPSFGRNSVLRLDRPAAVKTGTTTDWRDNWTVGYTPDLVTGVWVGNADNTPMLGVSGVAGAGPIWHDFMAMAHRHRAVRRFPQPEGLVRTEICADSGLLPTDYCSRRRSELFIAGTEPVDYDTVFRPVLVDACNGGTVPGPETTSTCLEERVFRVYPPELQEWARANGIPQPDSGQWSVVSGRNQEDTNCPLSPGHCALILTSPDPNSVYRLSAALPAGLQQVRLAARPSSTPQRIVFSVNGQVVGSATAPPYEVWWPLEPGAHLIGATAEGPDQVATAEPIWIEVQ